MKPGLREICIGRPDCELPNRKRRKRRFADAGNSRTTMGFAWFLTRSPQEEGAAGFEPAPGALLMWRPEAGGRSWPPLLTGS